jgi:methyl-accepting chemotaxis protein
MVRVQYKAKQWARSLLERLIKSADAVAPLGVKAEVETEPAVVILSEDQVADLIANQEAQHAAEREALLAEKQAYAQICGLLQTRLAQVEGFVQTGPDLTRLLSQQLDQTNSTTEDAAVQIMQRLINVDAEAAQLLASQLAGKERAAQLHHNADILLQNSKRSLSEMESYRLQREKEIEAVSAESAAVMGVLARVSDLKNVANAIQSVTKMTNLLAVNAAIEAARAGEAGKGFAAVATEVRGLSGQIANLAKRIEQSIDEVSTSVNVTFGARMVSEANKGAEETVNETLWIATMGDTIGQLSADFTQTISEFEQMAQTTYMAAGSIKSAIVDVLGFAQFQDTTRQQIEQVQTGLNLFGDRLGGVRGHLQTDVMEGGAIEPLETLLSQLSAGYTMASQRQIHAAATDSEVDQDDGPAIQLF